MKAKETSAGAKRRAAGSPARSRRKAIAKTKAIPGKGRSPSKLKAVAKTKRAAAKPKAVKRKVAPRKKALEIPPILLEGDRPAPPPMSGPGQKFALGPTPPALQLEPETAELPEAYGTKQLFLAARDPHWLYASWDLTRAQQLRYNAKSADGHLILRVYAGSVSGQPVSEIHVHPESRHWFAHVERAGTKYAAALGYYQAGRKWAGISTSGPTLTPPDTVSTDSSARFTTIPVELTFAKLVAMVKGALRESAPLAQALEELRQSGHPELPARAQLPAAAWTPAQERALAQVISMDLVQHVWMGSLEITELIRRRVELEISSLGVAQFGLPAAPAGAVSSISSPFGGAQRPKGFWFNINAELIIYGATEADATVTIGGRKIKLRPDGSFSCRFALPDGKYELPVVAISADQTDGRGAELKFSRKTDFRGDVGAQPQDPALKPPKPENL
jgi:uncharacterized protein